MRFLALVVMLLSFSHAADGNDCRGLLTHVQPGMEDYSPLWGVAQSNSGLINGLRNQGFWEFSKDSETEKQQRDFLQTNVKKALNLLESTQAALVKKYGQGDIGSTIRHINSELSKVGAEDKGMLLVLESDLHVLREKFTDVPQNSIAAWIQWLFVSHLSGVVIPNYSHYDPIGDLVNEDSLDTANELLAAMISYERDSSTWDDVKFTRHIQTLFGNFLLGCRLSKDNTRHHDRLKTDICDRFKKICGFDLTVPDAPKQDIQAGRNKYSARDRDKFLGSAIIISQVLLEALKEEKTLANPDLAAKQVYPEKTVARTFLQFLWERLKNPEAFFKLSTIMQHPTAPLGPFTEEDYLRVSTDPSPFLRDPTPENIELLTYAFGVYNTREQTIPDLVTYRGGVKVPSINKVPIDLFYNCGEVSVLNFFIIAFWDHGQLNFDWMDVFYQRFPTELMDKIRSHFKKFPTLSQLKSYASHCEWSHILCNLNRTGGHESTKVTYAKGTKSGLPGVDGLAEIYGGGIVNMLNVLGRLLEDDMLLNPWASDNVLVLQEAYTKLKMLCEIISRNGKEYYFVEANNVLLNKEVIALTSQYPKIIFSWHGGCYVHFQWSLDLFHFDIINFKLILGVNSNHIETHKYWLNLPWKYHILFNSLTSTLTNSPIVNNYPMILKQQLFDVQFERLFLRKEIPAFYSLYFSEYGFSNPIHYETILQNFFQNSPQDWDRISFIEPIMRSLAQYSFAPKMFKEWKQSVNFDALDQKTRVRVDVMFSEALLLSKNEDLGHAH